MEESKRRDAETAEVRIAEHEKGVAADIGPEVPIIWNQTIKLGAFLRALRHSAFR